MFPPMGPAASLSALSLVAGVTVAGLSTSLLVQHASGAPIVFTGHVDVDFPVGPGVWPVTVVPVCTVGRM